MHAANGHHDDNDTTPCRASTTAALKTLGARLDKALTWNLILDGQRLVIWRHGVVVMPLPTMIAVTDQSQYAYDTCDGHLVPISPVDAPDAAARQIEQLFAPAVTT